MKTLMIKNHTLLFDDNDYEYILSLNMKLAVANSLSKNSTHATSRFFPYLYTTKKEKRLLVSRFLMQRIVGGEIPEGMIVDHKDNNPLNNARSNLILTTKANNNKRKKKRSGSSTSKFKGVYKSKNRWVAQCTSNGSSRTKRFLNEEDAARQYDEWSLEMHEEFALTNEMLGLYE